MRKIVRIGDRSTDGDILIPSVYYPEGRGSISPQKRGAEHALYNAVLESTPGDLLIQDDVTMLIDPWAAPFAFGYIRTFAPPWQEGHYCPRAFMYYDLHVKDALLAAWNPERPDIPHDEYACLAWAHIPSRKDFMGAQHG